MKSVASIDQPLLTNPAADDALAALGNRLAAYVSLTKPRLVLLVLVTVAVGFLLGPRSSVSAQRAASRKHAGQRETHGCSRSNCKASASNSSSWPYAAANIDPIGIVSAAANKGSEIAGVPATFCSFV